MYSLDRGFIAEGMEADLVCLDTPMGSTGTDLMSCLQEGDTPGVSVILVDGKVVATKSRNTPPPVRKATTV